MPIKLPRLPKLPKRRRKVFAVLPTLLTLGNAVCGFGAITFADRWAGYDREPALFTAGCLLFLAMVFDALDGAAARWTNQSSEFGAHLDSLCDAISFGAAPAVLMLELARPLGYHPRVLWVVAALYTVCALLRLARFTAAVGEDHDPGIFRGLPSPAAAAVVASFPIMLFGPQVLSDGGAWGGSGLDEWASQAMPIVTLAAAGLMVSRVRYPHAFHRLVRGRRSRPHLVRLVFATGIVVAVPRVAVPLLAGWYAFAPPAAALWNRYLRGLIFPNAAALPPTTTPDPHDGRGPLNIGRDAHGDAGENGPGEPGV